MVKATSKGDGAGKGSSKGKRASSASKGNTDGGGAGKTGASTLNAAEARKQRNRESALRSRERKRQVIDQTREKILVTAAKKETLQARVARLRAQNQALKNQIAAAAAGDAPPSPLSDLAGPAGMPEDEHPLGESDDEPAEDMAGASRTDDDTAPETPVPEPLLTDLLDGLLDPLADGAAGGTEPVID